MSEDEYIVTVTLYCPFCGRIETTDTVAFKDGQMELVICDNGHFSAAMVATYLNLQHKASPSMMLRRKNAQAY